LHLYYTTNRIQYTLKFLQNYVVTEIVWKSERRD
jgi:hypothetical protein